MAWKTINKKVKIIKDYEKIAIGIGVTALGFAAYQAFKAKEAVDAVQATDPKKNPVDTAIDLSKHIVGNAGNWFTNRYDAATGYTKGKADAIVNTLWTRPSDVVYHYGGKITDLGKGATEAGTKYVWGAGANIAKSGKEKVYQLTNKGFTLMGSAPRYVYDSARKLPITAAAIKSMATGIGSKLEKTTGSARNKIGGWLTRLRGG